MTGPTPKKRSFALHRRAPQERAQAAYDRHSLPAKLSSAVDAFIAIASTVNFAAPTVEKGETTVFVNPAREQQGAPWKACFRAEAPPTAAALALAKGLAGGLQGRSRQAPTRFSTADRHTAV